MNKLNKDIKIIKDSYPIKTSFNFIEDDEERYNKLSIICFAIFLAVLVIFTKFGVIDTLSKTSALQANYSSVESTNNSLKEQLTDYDEIAKKYNEIAGDFLTENEVNSLNRDTIIKMLDESVFPYVDITNFTASGNQISIFTDETDLNTVSKVLEILQDDERTSYVSISRTLSNSDNNERVTADIEIVIKNMEGSN